MSDAPDRSRRFEPDAIIGHYRIIARAGAGGMGNVYKAIDTRLNRPVAIKAISDSRLRDPKAAGRLRTEALAAASLDHPYICKIYELFDTGDETLIVMEFVEGETLAGILRRGTPPLPQTLQLSAEIAEGLANAHGRGLVHRDVKPSNVMVTPHGHVKLLDFGLAQADVEARPDAHTHTSPSEGGGHGGTPQYMAPEQASGGAITARADRFSLGAIIFECLTSKLPFEGTTSYDYVRHLLSDAPRPLYRLAPQAPADLVALVEQCLEKTPSRRPDAAAEVVAELRRIADAIASPTTTLSSIRAARRQRRWRLTLTVAIVALAALVIWRWPTRSGRDLTPRQTRPVVTWPSEESGSRISPDARWLSFISTRGGPNQLFVQPIDGTDAKPVTLPAGKVLSQLWSPDGRALGYVLSRDDGVRFEIVPAFFGGTPSFSIAIEQNPASPRLLRWIDRTVYLQFDAGANKRVLLRIDLDQKAVTNVSDSWNLPGVLRGFDVSPDGKRVAFNEITSGQEDLWVAAISGASPKRLTNDTYFDRYPLWTGRGETIIFQSNRGGPIDLWEISPDGGQPWSLTSSQTEEIPESVSLDGSLISFQQVSEAATLWTWESAQKSRQLTADALSDVSPTASADGRVVVFQRSQPSPSRGFLLLDSKLFSGALTATGFSTDPQAVAEGFAPRLSPDGTRVAYFQRNPGVARTTLLVKELNSDRTVPISTTCPLPPFLPFPADWAEHSLAWDPSGTSLYFIEQQETHTIRRVRLGSDAPPPPPLVTAKPNEAIRDVYVSASGKLLAYIVKTQTIWVVHLLDLETGADRAMAHFEDMSYLRGWLKNDAGLVAISVKHTAEDGTSLVDVFVLGPEGGVRRSATIDKAFFPTIRLAPSRAAVYVTRSENGVHNLFSVPLTAGTPQRVTDNTLTGVTFSGIEQLVGDAVIGVRDERKTDIYLIEKKTDARR